MSSRKQADKMHPAALRAMLDSEVWRDLRDTLAEAKAAFWAKENEQLRQWLAAYIERVDPEPGQQCGTILGSKIGLKKRSEVAWGLRKYFGRTQRHYLAQGGMVVEAAVNCLEMSPASLTKACARAAKQSLDQMMGNDKPAGFILSAQADGTVVRVRMMVTDPIAQKKLSHQVYAGVVAEFEEDDRLHRVSLVDSDNLAKASDASVICKVFDREGEVKKRLRKQAARLARQTGRSFDECAHVLGSLRKVQAPVLPPSAERALAQKAHADALAQSGAVEGYIAKALQQRANDACGLELIKAARSRPVSYGDLGMINFLRGGRP